MLFIRCEIFFLSASWTILTTQPSFCVEELWMFWTRLTTMADQWRSKSFLILHRQSLLNCQVLLLDRCAGRSQGDVHANPVRLRPRRLLPRDQGPPREVHHEEATPVSRLAQDAPTEWKIPLCYHWWEKRFSKILTKVHPGSHVDFASHVASYALGEDWSERQDLYLC